MKKTTLSLILIASLMLGLTATAFADDSKVSKTYKTTEICTAGGKTVLYTFNNDLEKAITEKVMLKLDDVDAKFAEKSVQIKMNIDKNAMSADEKMSSPYMGIYVEELSLAKAKALNYNKFYGVLITGIVSNSPAKYYRLMEDDIIMQMGDSKIEDQDSFNKVKDSFYVGDSIQIVVFRSGSEKTVPFKFGSREQKDDFNFGTFGTNDITVTATKAEGKKLSVGFGGGTWMPMWFAVDLDDVNGLLHEGQFGKVGSDSGILLQGGGGKGNVGKGIFLGGMGAGYTIDRKKNVRLEDGSSVIRRMTYNIGFGGVTLDKRYAISRKIIVSPGFMIGGGSQSVELSQTDGSYDWDSTNVNLSNKYNNSIQYKRSFILIQPKFELMYRINGWLGLRVEAGYLYGYSSNNGWKSTISGDEFEIDNSPNTRFQGYTISAGPWFGF